jgi:hypothetical protein
MGRHAKSALVLMVRCDLHPQRPLDGCARCHDAIMVNRANQGASLQYLVAEDGTVTEWHAYQPVRSWSGPDAFLWREHD